MIVDCTIVELDVRIVGSYPRLSAPPLWIHVLVVELSVVSLWSWPRLVIERGRLVEASRYRV